MNNRIKISIWTYLSILAAVTVAGCWAAQKYVLPPSQPVSVNSPQGKVLVAALSCQWHVRGVRHIPGMPGDLIYKTVMIDPGHGGKDPGAQGVDGDFEKNIVLDIGLRLQKILERHGVHVIMTRSDDEFFSLEERAEMVRQYHPDLFLSLHANSSSDADVSGMEVYYAEEEVYWAHIHNTLNEIITGTSESILDGPEALYEYHDFKKAFREESEVFAKHFAAGVARAVGARNRGVKRQHFYVLTKAEAPAILIEMGFMTHPDEGRKLATEQYRQTLAEAMAKNLLNYVKAEQ